MKNVASKITLIFAIAISSLLAPMQTSGLSEPDALVCICAEENGAISANQNEYSTGNGSVGVIGIPLPYQWELVAVGFQADVFAAGATATIGIQDNRNGVTSTIYQFVATAQDFSFELPTPVAIPENATLGFRTLAVTGGTKSDVRVAAWIRRIK